MTVDHSQHHAVNHHQWRTEHAIRWVTWMLENRPDLDTVDQLEREVQRLEQATADSIQLSRSEIRGVVEWLEQGGWVVVDGVGGDLYIDSRGKDEKSRVHWRPNMWADLKAAVGEDVYRAHSLRDTIRGLVRAGWRVETTPGRVNSNLGVTAHRPPYAVMIRGVASPVIHHPEMSAVQMHIERLWQAGAWTQVLICDERNLEAVEGEVRSYLLDRPSPAPLTIFILPAPGYQPVVITGGLHSVDGDTMLLMQELQQPPPMPRRDQQPPSDWQFPG